MRNLERSALRLDRAVALLVSPQQRLRQQGERLQTLVQRLAQAPARPHEARAARLAMLSARLTHASPRPAGLRRAVAAQARRPAAVLERGVARRQHQLAASMTT